MSGCCWKEKTDCPEVVKFVTINSVRPLTFFFKSSKITTQETKNEKAVIYL